jgi:spore germination protein YaaH
MKTGLPSAVINSDLIQDISPFWYTLKSATKITDLYTPANPSIPLSTPSQTCDSNPSSPLQILQCNHFTILPTITDGTAKLALAGLLANPTTRAQVVSTILNLVLTNNFDGIDLDFENFAFVDGTSSWAATQPNWIQFISDLSLSLHLNGKLLSVTTPVLFDPASGKKGYYVYAWSAIASAIDRLRIMTYDYSTSTPGPIGPITWVEQTVQYAVAVVPASKVYIGVAGYGRDWVTAVSGVCPVDVASVISTKAKAATFVMRDASNLAASYGVVPVYTPKYAESTFTYQKVYNGQTSTGLSTQCTATRTAWFQDPQGYSVRANLVGKYRLGGIAAWTLGMEDSFAMPAVRTVAQSIAPDIVIATLAANSLTPTLGSAITLTGKFALPDSRPIPGLTASVQIKNSLGDWRTVFSGTTGVDGRISTPIVLGEITSARVVSDGSWERLQGLSTPLGISVKRIVSWSLPTSVKAGSTIKITGSIQPKVAGVTVTLEGATSAPATTDSTGQFTFTLKADVLRVKRIRASVAADDKFVAASTPYSYLLVR